MKMHRFTLQAEVEPVRFEPGSNPTELFLLLAHLSQDHKTDSEICSFNKYLQRTHYVQGLCQVLSTHWQAGPCHWVGKCSVEETAVVYRTVVLLYLYAQVCGEAPYPSFWAPGRLLGC